MEIRTISMEKLMLLDIKDNIEVTTGGTLETRFPLATETKLHSTVNTTGDLHFELSFLLHPSSAIAIRTG